MGGLWNKPKSASPWLITTTTHHHLRWPKSLSLSLNLTSLPRSNPKVSTFLREWSVRERERETQLKWEGKREEREFYWNSDLVAEMKKSKREKLKAHGLPSITCQNNEFWIKYTSEICAIARDLSPICLYINCFQVELFGQGAVYVWR